MKLLVAALLAIAPSLNACGATTRGQAAVPSNTSNKATRALPSLRSAQIFYIPWSILTYAALAPDTVRRSPQRSVVIRDSSELEHLLAFLDLVTLQLPDATPDFAGDFRLVVDLTWADGSTDSLAADRFHVVRLRDGASHPIDESFRHYFESRHYD